MTLRVMLVLAAMRVSAAGEETRPVVRKPRLRAVTVSGSGPVEEGRVAADFELRERSVAP